jgi:outer membrane receptor protein involved in Fe transport
MQITPLRAWAHDVPRYYLQNFGNPVSHPNSNDYAGFLQDTVRLTGRLALSLGVRYDLQTFNSKDLVNNPLWRRQGRCLRIKTISRRGWESPIRSAISGRWCSGEDLGFSIRATSNLRIIGD